MKLIMLSLMVLMTTQAYSQTMEVNEFNIRVLQPIELRYISSSVVSPAPKDASVLSFNIGSYERQNCRLRAYRMRNQRSLQIGHIQRRPEIAIQVDPDFGIAYYRFLLGDIYFACSLGIPDSYHTPRMLMTTPRMLMTRLQDFLSEYLEFEQVKR